MDRSGASESSVCSFVTEGGDTCHRPATDGSEHCRWHRPVAGKEITDPPKPGDGTLAGAYLVEAQIEELTIEGVDLRLAELAGARITGSTFRDVDLQGATLSEATVADSRLVRTTLDRVQAEAAEFTTSRFDGVEATGASFRGAAFTDAAVERSTFDEATLVGCDFRRARIDDTRFERAVLSDSGFREAELYLSSFERARGQHLTFGEAVIEESSFRDATLTAADWGGVTLVNGEFTDASLVDGEFTGATVTRSDFRRAELTGCEFGGATLRDSDLSATNLREANLGGTALEGTLFRDARLSETTQLFGPSGGGRGGDDVGTGRGAHPEGEAGGDRQAAVYRRLARAARDAGLSRTASELRLRQRRAERRNAFQEALNGGPLEARLAAFGRYLQLVLANVVAGHGERPARVVSSSTLVIVAFAALYQATTTFGSPAEWLTFSLSVFIVGVEQPTLAQRTFLIQQLVALESTLGVVLAVAFGYTLVRRSLT